VCQTISHLNYLVLFRAGTQALLPVRSYQLSKCKTATRISAWFELAAVFFCTAVCKMLMRIAF
jgi:hypothetical protein